MQSRRTLLSVPGGDTMRILKTRKYLVRDGVRCDVSLDLEPDLAGYDLVHLFNVIRPQELYLQMRNAKRRGVPVVLSPVYVDYSEFERHDRSVPVRLLARSLPPSTVEYLKVAARAVRNGERHRGTVEVLVHGYRRLVERVLRGADLLTPGSRSELTRLRRDFDLDTPFAIVPAGVDHRLFEAAPDGAPEEWQELRDCVLCVARIEGLKNQRRVVLAARGAPYTVVIVGEAAPNHRGYARRVRREAPENVRFLGRVEHEWLPALYRLARVHVLASWMETAGLTSLEAALCSCNIVVTDRGDQRDYFGDLAHYCEPGSVASIRQAVDRAWSCPVNPALRAMVLERYTWERSAALMLEAYGSLLASC